MRTRDRLRNGTRWVLVYRRYAGKPGQELWAGFSHGHLRYRDLATGRFLRKRWISSTQLKPGHEPNETSYVPGHVPWNKGRRTVTAEERRAYVNAWARQKRRQQKVAI